VDNRLILVTGATGFVGTALCHALSQQGYRIRRAVRSGPHAAVENAYPISDMTQEAAWQQALQGVSAVIHLAARTHVLDDRSADPLAEYRKVNVQITNALARQAAANGVRRLVFLSSIKVNGESTAVAPYAESDLPAPEDAYGISKLEAERALEQIAKTTGLETVILRPPLVYGPQVKGNFLRMLGAVSRGMPLPFASVNNRRSLIYVGNLVDAIITCINAPAAAGKTYLLSDGEDIASPVLIGKLAAAMGKSARLLPCPPALLMLGATMFGKQAAAARLLGSLRVDSTRIRRELGWQPRYSLDQGLSATAQWYHQSQSK
jgi:nucleoside-diphosphate-sugar epimerase